MYEIIHDGQTLFVTSNLLRVMIAKANGYTVIYRKDL